MFRHNRILIAHSLVALLLTMTFATVSPETISAENECIIPDAGPWPPCATGGNSVPASTANSDNCTIPPSGPWPPCATGGSAAPAPSSNNNECVIPSSGPWPPCATNGNAPPSATPNTPNTSSDVLKTHTYTSDEARDLFVAILNNEVNSAAAEAKLSTGFWEPNSVLRTSEYEVVLESSTPLRNEDVRRLHSSIGIRRESATGELHAQLIWIEIRWIRVDGRDEQGRKDLDIYQAAFFDALDARLQANLAASNIESMVMTDDSSFIVTYR